MDGYRLPISLGVFNVDESNHQGHQLVDDLTIITGMLTHYQQKAGPDYRPEVCACVYGLIQRNELLHE